MKQALPIADILEILRKIVGNHYVVTNSDEMKPYLKEWRDLFTGKALCIVRPASTNEVAAIVKAASQCGFSIVPQGGNTGLMGGQIPTDEKCQIVLSLSRMNAITDIDPSGFTMTAQAGAILETIQNAADEAERFFPLSLGAQGSCQIGGNLSTNAGGTGVLAYGNTRDLVLGLEVVLADGTIVNGLSKLRKDNTGYDLKHLFIGAEGTLGIITAASLKLFPKPKGKQVAFAGFETLEQVSDTFAHLKSALGNDLTAFEFLPRLGLEFVLRNVDGSRDPLTSPFPWYVLIECISGHSEEDAQNKMEAAFQSVFEKGFVADAALATSSAQQAMFWKMRHEMSGAQKPEGGSIKHDVSVPIQDLPAFLKEAGIAVEQAIPNSRIVSFGHWGDGNIHFNISQPIGVDKEAFLARWDEMNEVVHKVVLSYGGSISAEHGIGILKKELLAKVKDPASLALMRTLKTALDPKNIFNPGKVLK